jgi:hypothetical protein
LGAAIAVYANSVAGTFVLDDLPWIVDNPAIRDLWPPWSAAGGTLRPLLFYSLALNFAVSGLSPWSYHVVNAAIHSLAGLLLWGLLRRSLRLPRVGTPVAAQTESIAFATALLWLVHPLHTQAVTYVIQRGESMAAMWMLAALYAFVRGVDSDASQRWRAVVPIAWLAALATKEVAVVLPALVLAVDVLLVTGSLSQSLRRHRALYLTLGAPVALTLIVGLWLRPEVVAGLLRGDGQGISRGQYAASQAGVVLEYARLVLWPRSLSVDHGVPPVADLREALWPVVLVSAGLVATTWGLWRRRPVALLGIWPAVLLAPTSSVVPLRDLLVEHRMYLPAVAPLLVFQLASNAG